MTPDVIVSWPRSCDYPLWRAFILRERDRFGRVFVVFTEHDGGDYRTFVRESLPGVTCFDSPERGGRDWRDVAVNAALDASSAEWVWFTEQDFFITDPDYWDRLRTARHALGFRDENRWHPASLYVRRTYIDRTSRYFGPDPVDHFVTFSRELEAVTLPDHLTGYEHLQGLSQNHHLTDRGAAAEVFRRDRFRRYLADCLAADVPLHPTWARNARRELEGSAPL